MTGQLWALIQGWIDTRDFPPSQAKVADRLGVSTSLVSLWKRGETLPKPEQLRKVADVTGRPYLTVLNAALTDAGYLQREELMGNAQHPAPIGDEDDEGSRRRGRGQVGRQSSVRRSESKDSTKSLGARR